MNGSQRFLNGCSGTVRLSKKQGSRPIPGASWGLLGPPGWILTSWELLGWILASQGLLG